MKEIEELLDKMLLCSEEHLQSGVNEPTKYAELRAEIIKRFDELEKFYKHTHKVEYVAGITRPYEQKIAELEAHAQRAVEAMEKIKRGLDDMSYADFHDHVKLIIELYDWS